MEFHRSALKHGHDESSIMHAVNNAIAIIDLDPDADPPKVLRSALTLPATFSRSSGYDSVGVDLVIHAMRLRPTFFDLLPAADDQP